jgi:hypothetical protein
MSFDVLNPDYSTDKFKSIVATVTSNFKNLFIQSCPRCRAFNIRDFKVRHIAVPKFNFRYFAVENILHLIISSYVFLCLYQCGNIWSDYSKSISFVRHRYDSGIFVLQFIISFDGIKVKMFSNVRLWIESPENIY